MCERIYELLQVGSSHIIMEYCFDHDEYYPSESHIHCQGVLFGMEFYVDPLVSHEGQ